MRAHGVGEHVAAVAGEHQAGLVHGERGERLGSQGPSCECGHGTGEIRGSLSGQWERSGRPGQLLERP